MRVPRAWMDQVPALSSHFPVRARRLREAPCARTPRCDSRWPALHRQRELRVEFGRLLVAFAAPFQVLAGSTEQVMVPLEISFVRGNVRSVLFPRLRLAGKLGSERSRNCAGHFILYGEDIAQLTVVSFRPEMKSVGRF